MPIVPRWAFPVDQLGLLGSKDGLHQSLVDRVQWVAIPLRVLVNQFVIFLIVHRSISLFPCAIGVSHPVSNLIFNEVRNARPAIIGTDSFPIEAFVRLCVRPCGHQNNAETIAALYATVGGNVVHVSIPHGPFLLLGRTDVGAVARSSGPH